MVNYCNAMTIIRRLDVEDLTEQNRIRELVKEAMSWIDTKLQNYTTLPLTSVPERIKHICEERVAIKFRMDKAPIDEALKESLDLVEKALDEYIEAEYKKGRRFLKA